LRTTLQGACKAAQEEYERKERKPGKPYKTAILVTPVIAPAAKAVGFYKEDYKFTLAVHVLDNALNKKEVAPEKWHLSAND